MSDNLISGPSGGSVQTYSDLFDLSQNEGLARWNAGERSMAMRFLIHFLKPNEGHGSWYAFMGNEVAHSSPFLANWFEPHLTQNAVRRIALFGFRNTAGGCSATTTLGATSAWYVWTAMGMYPVIPGVGGVTLVAPSFRTCGDIGTWGQVGEAAFEQRHGAGRLYSVCAAGWSGDIQSLVERLGAFARRGAGFSRLARPRAVGVRMLPTRPPSYTDRDRVRNAGRLPFDLA